MNKITISLNNDKIAAVAIFCAVAERLNAKFGYSITDNREITVSSDFTIYGKTISEIVDIAPKNVFIMGVYSISDKHGYDVVKSATRAIDDILNVVKDESYNDIPPVAMFDVIMAVTRSIVDYAVAVGIV